MTDYALCFDFPSGDEPWFATYLRDGLGWTQSLASAARFSSEEEAERVLTNGYGPEARACGVVVEIGEVAL